MINNMKFPCYIIFVLGLGAIIVEFLAWISDSEDFTGLPSLIGIILIILAVILLQGRTISKVSGGRFSIETVSTQMHEPPRKLDVETLEVRRNFSSQIEESLPGNNAPAFNVLEEKIALTVIPCSDPMTPMYMLDNNYRIIDWNSSFSTCFDRTMEGRRGLNVLEWTYFLDNYQEVLDHGVKAFANPDNLPMIDVEELQYTSRFFGHIKATKRAYHIPNDDGSCLGWLITIEPEFASVEMSNAFQASLFTSLRLSLMWSEYALSYDIVLNQSDIYPELIKKIIGQSESGPPPVQANTKVLDLGAGTGNITAMLAYPQYQRLVVAIDNNPVMLHHLRNKCHHLLRHDAQGPGVIVLKQDITSLYGLNDNFFDVVIVNNVLYSLPAALLIPCIREIFRVLVSGGEVRISEPHKKASAEKVMSVIKKELHKNGHFEQVKEHYFKVEQINNYALAPMLNKMDLIEMEQTLKNIGFSEITYREDKTYARQSFLVCAKKA